jgi:hypothetical protein
MSVHHKCNTVHGEKCHSVYLKLQCSLEDYDSLKQNCLNSSRYTCLISCWTAFMAGGCCSLLDTLAHLLSFCSVLYHQGHHTIKSSFSVLILKFLANTLVSILSRARDSLATCICLWNKQDPPSRPVHHRRRPSSAPKRPDSRSQRR